MRRFAGLLLLTLVVAGGVLWLERAWLASSVATSLLGRAGFSQARVVVSDLDSTSLSIDRLRFTTVVPGGILHFRLSGLHATYRVDTVWKRKRLEQVTVRSAILEYQPRATTSTRKPMDLSGLQTLIRGDWLEQIPLQYLHIDRLVFRNPPGLPAGNLVVGLTVRNAPGRLQADVALPSIRRNMNLSLARDTGLEVQLDLESRYRPAVTLTLREEQGGRPALVWQGDLDAVREWLAPLYPLPSLGGDFQGHASLALDPGSGLALRVDTRTDKVQVPGLDIGSLNLAGTLEFTGKEDFGLRFGCDLRLELQDLRRSALHIDRLSLGLAGLVERIDGHWQVRLDPENHWLVTGLTRGTLELARVTVRPGLRLALEDKQWRLELGRDFQVQASGCRLDTLQADELRLYPAQDATILRATGSPFSWQVAPSSWMLSTTGAGRAPWQVLTAEPLDIRIDVLEGAGSSWKIEAAVRSPLLSIDGPYATTLTNLEGTLRGDERHLLFEMALSPEFLPGRLVMNLDLEPKTGRTHGEFRTTEPIVPTRDSPLSRLVTPWPVPVDMVQGELKVDGLFSRTPAAGSRCTTSISISGGKGVVGKEIHFSGLDQEVRLRLVPGIATLRPGSVRCEKIVLPGRIELTGVEAFTELQSGKDGGLELVLENLRATLFNGLITTPRITYALDNRSADFTLTLRHLDLEEVLKVYPVSDLQVRGRVGGLLPVRLRGSEVTVTDGRLVAEPPGGEIRYRPRNSGVSDQGLTGITLRALRELHYRDLEIEVGYLPDGTLDLNFHFKGTSPELDARRPVHLNINTSQNLLSLLRSLRYTEEIDTDISRRVEKRYGNGQER
ncbi:intermembrane phospholipid transport protein YdbH family protein [Desulfolithobacter sp.]